MTAPVPIIVTGCADCPLRSDEEDLDFLEFLCRHPEFDAPQVIRSHMKPTPRWCPLIKGNAIITLRPR